MSLPTTPAAPETSSGRVTVEEAARHSGSLSWPVVARDSVWWCRSDPGSGLVRLVRRDGDGTQHDVLADQWSVRNAVNGYGGRAFCIDGERLVFTSYPDGRLHRADPYGTNGPAVPLTDTGAPWRTTWFADLQLPAGADRVWAIREVTAAGDGDPALRTARDIVTVDLDGSGRVESVARAQHFLTSLRISPSGTRLAWVGWEHPAMPWQSTELWVADLDGDGAVGARRVLGGQGVSVPQAEWADDDTLYAMADPDGWWNLHRVGVDGTSTCVLPMPRACAGPVWRVGASWFAVAGGRVVLAHGCGDQQLVAWDPTTGQQRELAAGWTQFDADVSADSETAVVVAASASRAPMVLAVPIHGASPVACSDDETSAAADAPRRRTAVDTTGQVVHYVFHPASPPLSGSALPPLLVHAHGGPTSRTGASPDAEFALFTSRGFAVASVDYGGSTGYGRAYRERLDGNWGIVDVADCVTVADALTAAGEVDGSRVAVRGGSAGGFTALACLAFTDRFCAGAVYYPIADLLRWSGESTHDFESRYLDTLVGRWPEERARYEAQSPLQHVDAISAPLVMLQGADDPICPPMHAEAVIDAVRARGLWHRLEVFPGEGHGFRKATSVATSLTRELELYDHAMGLDGRCLP